METVMQCFCTVGKWFALILEWFFYGSLYIHFTHQFILSQSSSSSHSTHNSTQSRYMLASQSQANRYDLGTVSAHPDVSSPLFLFLQMMNKFDKCLGFILDLFFVFLSKGSNNRQPSNMGCLSQLLPDLDQTRGLTGAGTASGEERVVFIRAHPMKSFCKRKMKTSVFDPHSHIKCK